MKVISSKSSFRNSSSPWFSFLGQALFVILVITWPAIKTFASIWKSKAKTQLKWCYYWISVPVIFFFVELLGFFFSKEPFFVVFQVIIALVVSYNNGTICVHITIKFMAPLFKKYYSRLKKLPGLALQVIFQVFSVMGSFFKAGIQPEKPVTPMKKKYPATVG